MSAIKQALEKLDQRIIKLEGVLEAQKRNSSAPAYVPKAGDQPDMFAMPSNQNTPGAPALSRSSVVRQLDMAIAKVEKLLAEG